MFRKFSILFLTSFICGIYSCNSNSSESNKDILLSNLDSTINPADDFFDFANGGWIKKNPIPNDLNSWGIAGMVQEETLERLKKINEIALSKNDKEGSANQKIGDFWSIAMDSSKIEKQGLEVLKPYINLINQINDSQTLVKTIGEFHKMGVPVFFENYIAQDSKNSDAMAFHLYQGGLGLPEREYYFKNDSTTINIRAKYLEYINNVLVLSGIESSKAFLSAKKILDLETKLAKSSRKMEDLRDPYTNYNKMKIDNLSKLNSKIDWVVYLNSLKIKDTDSVIVGQPEFFNAMGVVLKTTPMDDIKNYLTFNLIQTYSESLPEKYGKEAFNFNKLLTGAKERRPRWKRVLSIEEQLIGELLGQLYVKEYYSEKAKNRYILQVEAIRMAMKERISKLTWMSDSTKEKAYIKLATMKKKVGYPDKWKDFSSLSIGKESYTKNIINAHLWQHRFQVSKLGKPVDRDEWDMTPQTYNAYYNPSNNEIVIPAAIMIVPGYKDEDLDDALTYGYVAASTIGHEITHGFDDEGRQFDEKGNLKNWWNKQDGLEFTKRADVMVKQFDSYEPIKGYHINGKASLGENIADLGGILLGIDAFKKTEQYKKGEKISGYTPIQRFFMGYALGWLQHQKEESLKNRLLSDVHSPAKYRVNGPFVDVDEFYAAFNVKPTNKMFRLEKDRVRIW